MSRSSLPDLLGLRKIWDNGAETVPMRRTLDLRGEVTVADNPQAKRLDVVVGAPAVIRPPPLSASQSEWNPPGFGTASVIYVSSTVPGVSIEPNADPENIRTLRRVWINVGAFRIDFDMAPVLEFRSLQPNHSLVAMYDRETEQWIMPNADPE